MIEAITIQYTSHVTDHNIYLYNPRFTFLSNHTVSCFIFRKISYFIQYAIRHAHLCNGGMRETINYFLNTYVYVVFIDKIRIYIYFHYIRSYLSIISMANGSIITNHEDYMLALLDMRYKILFLQSCRISSFIFHTSLVSLFF